MLCHYLTQCRNQFQFFVDALFMFRRRYYFNFEKKIFLFLLHPYFPTMAFGSKFDILVNTVFPLDYGATDCTNDFHLLFPHFASWILSFIAVSYQNFTPLHHYSSKYGCFYTSTIFCYHAPPTYPNLFQSSQLCFLRLTYIVCAFFVGHSEACQPLFCSIVLLSS